MSTISIAIPIKAGDSLQESIDAFSSYETPFRIYDITWPDGVNLPQETTLMLPVSLTEMDIPYDDYADEDEAEEAFEKEWDQTVDRMLAQKFGHTPVRYSFEPVD